MRTTWRRTSATPCTDAELIQQNHVGACWAKWPGGARLPLENKVRIQGRTLRPSNLAERRLLLSLGSPALRVPRAANPYLIARRLERAARGNNRDVLFVCDVLNRASKGSSLSRKVADPSKPDYGSTPE